MKFVISTIVLAFMAASLFANAELKLASGATTIDIVDGSALDSNPVPDVVTYIGAVGSWNVNVTTGLEVGLPLFDLVSIDATANQKDPISLYFSDELALSSWAVFDVGGTLSDRSTPTIEFRAWTGSSKFDLVNEIGAPLTFHTAAFSGSTNGAVDPSDTAVTIAALIDLGDGNAGTASFDAALDKVPEPASIFLLGGVLLFVAGMRKRLA